MLERTGGQYCVAGLVLQFLAGLDGALRVIVTKTDTPQGRLTGAVMVLEPVQGGDHVLELGATRYVEQIKIRTTGKSWTAGDIAGEVLPDLFRAVSGSAAKETRYRFLTDGTLGCDGLLALAARLRTRPVPADPIGALDDSDPRAFRYGRWLSERAFFIALMRRAGIDDPGGFWRLVAGFEAEGGLTQDMLDARIDHRLSGMLDAGEDAAGKRHELIGRMARLAQSGGTITAAGLLDQAGLPAERLLHRARLPAILRARLSDDLETLGYSPAHDVRERPRATGGELLLISGDSGLGKSWRLAALLAHEAEQGRLALLAPTARTVGDIRRAIIERVWLSGYDREIDLPGLQRRLGPAFTGEDRVWLTVGVDDLHDRELLVDLHREDWRQYGIRLVATVPTGLAEEMAQRPRPPAEHRVGRFRRAQLHRFLGGHGHHVRDLPDDVADLLCTPIFAELYRRSFAPEWRPTNEYELVAGFWRHATYDSGGMADHQDDIVALERAARLLLDPLRVYPWRVEDALAAGLTADARRRLVRTGVLRQNEAGISVLHDRVLNWLVARALVADLAAGRTDVDGTVRALNQLGDPAAIAGGLGHRLGYVLMDLLWLGAERLPPSQLRNLIEQLLAAPEHRIDEGRFIEDDLAGLGPAILPVLNLMVTESRLARPRPVHAARAIASIGAAAPGLVEPIVAALLARDGAPCAGGLVAAGMVPVPQARERLWVLHRERRRAFREAPGELSAEARHELHDRTRASFTALRRALGDDAEWLDERLGDNPDPLSAELLLELLLETEHGVALPVWHRRKAGLLAAIPPGRGIIPSAIGRFGDVEEAARLEQETTDADFLESSRRFDALLRVAPQRAVDQLDRLSSELIRYGWFSMARLVRHGGAAAQARLLARHDPGWEGMRDLALSNAPDTDLIDRPAFEAVIAALAARFEELDGGEWRPRGEGHLVRFLSETRRPQHLAILRELRGSRFEALVRDLAIRRPPRHCATVDREGAELERLLLRIGGEGYGEWVAHAITSASPFAREDAYEAALRLHPGSPHATGLAGAARTGDVHQREHHDLVLALAAQRMDAPLYDLVAASASVSLDAIDIRTSLGPLDAGVEARLRADLASPESAVRSGAACALALAPPPDAAELLADTLARCPDEDPSALTVVRIAARLGHYLPRMLPQLSRMLASPQTRAREDILPFLAGFGDAQARAAVLAVFASETPPVVDHCALRAAYAISAHEPRGGPATERLRLFIDRRHGVYPLGLIAARLHRNGGLSDEELVELAYTTRHLSPDTSAHLIEAIGQFDPAEARAVAEYHFARAPSAHAARFLLTACSDQAGAMLERYCSEPRQSVRWLIARALRIHADQEGLGTQLAALAASPTSARRRAAAEIFGWLDSPASREQLDRLTCDREPRVADAAMASLARRRGHEDARELLAELPRADGLDRWSLLDAVVSLVDPYLLEADTSGLGLAAAIEPLGEALAIAAELAIKASKEKLQKEARQLDRAAGD